MYSFYSAIGRFTNINELAGVITLVPSSSLSIDIPINIDGKTIRKHYNLDKHLQYFVEDRYRMNHNSDALLELRKQNYNKFIKDRLTHLTVKTKPNKIIKDFTLHEMHNMSDTLIENYLCDGGYIYELFLNSYQKYIIAFGPETLKFFYRQDQQVCVDKAAIKIIIHGELIVTDPRHICIYQILNRNKIFEEMHVGSARYTR